MSEHTKSFARGAAVLALAGAVCRLLGAVYRVPLARALGEEGMGVYQGVFSLVALLLTLAAGGLPVAVSRLVSERRSLGDAAGAARVLTVARRALFALGALLAAVLFFGSSLFASLLALPAARPALRAAAPSLLLLALLAAYRGYFQGLSRMGPTAASQIAEQLTKMAAGLFFAARWGVGGPAWAAAGALFGVSVSEGAALLFLLACARRSRQKVPRRQPGDRALLERLCRIALPITAGSAVMPLCTAIDSAVILRALSSIGYTPSAAAAELGLLTGFVHPLVHLPGMLCMSLSVSLVPSLTAAAAQGRRDLAGREAGFALRLALRVSLPLCALFFLLARPLLQALYPSLTGDRLAQAALLLRLSCPGMPLLCLVQVSTGVLQGLSRPGAPLYALALGSAVKVAAGVALARIPGVGIAGAAVGSDLCFAIAAALDLLAIRRERLPPSRRAPLRVLLGLLACCGAALLLRPLSAGLPPRLALLLTLLAALAVYAILLVATGALSPGEFLRAFSRPRRRRQT